MSDEIDATNEERYIAALRHASMVLRLCRIPTATYVPNISATLVAEADAIDDLLIENARNMSALGSLPAEGQQE